VKEKLFIVKIGGNVVDDESALDAFLSEFHQLQGSKILVHGGGKLASDLAAKLSIPQTLVEGRRVTDAETLKVATMVYAGLINKTIVAKLQARGTRSFGLSGVDGNAILSVKRKLREVDFGFVGDVVSVNVELFQSFFDQSLVPIVAPITHDGGGQLLNTNADTIAQELARALANFFEVNLIYAFEKAGVLINVDDDQSVIPIINKHDFDRLKKDHKIFSGMIPKLDNAFQALDAGVHQVVLGKASELATLVTGKSGTTLKLKTETGFDHGN
jgi:acetylglutamate kinase